MSFFCTHPDPSLLIANGDIAYSEGLLEALQQRGFAPRIATECATARTILRDDPAAFVVVDAVLPDGSGIDLIEMARSGRPDVVAVVLSAHGDPRLAVAAARAGAADYLIKWATADEVAGALIGAPRGRSLLPGALRRPEDVRWMHIRDGLKQTDWNVSETARALGMHRRTLQRILNRRRPVELGDLRAAA